MFDIITEDESVLQNIGLILKGVGYLSTNLFKPGDLTHGEAEFISNVLKDDKTLDVGSLYMQRAQAIATLRLAKEIERSTASNNKASKAMNSLTGALVFVGALQAVILLINTFK